MLALHAEGFALKHPVVEHVLTVIDKCLWEAEEGLRMQVTHGPVWHTAQVS